MYFDHELLYCFNFYYFIDLSLMEMLFLSFYIDVISFRAMLTFSIQSLSLLYCVTLFYTVVLSLLYCVTLMTECYAQSSLVTLWGS